MSGVYYLLICGMEYMVYRLLLDSFLLKKGVDRRKENIGFVLCVVIQYLVAVIFQQLFLVKLPVEIVLYYTYAAVLYQGKWTRKAQVILFNLGIVSIADYIVVIGANVLIYFGILGTDWEAIPFYLLNAAVKVVLLIGMRSFRKYAFDRKLYLLEERILWRFLIFSILVLIPGLLLGSDIIKNGDDTLAFYMLLLLIVFMMMGVFLLLRDSIKLVESNKREKFLYLQTKSKQEHYEEVSQAYEEQKKEIHEFKNQLLCINEMLSQGNYGNAKKYVSGIIGDLEDNVNFIDTNHAMVNAVVNAKYKEACKKNILFILKVGDLSSLQVPEADIVTILANLLDNAMEACGKCEEQKYIRIKLTIENEKLFVLSVQNSMNETLHMEKGKILTSKSDKRRHGIGLQTIQELVMKNHGECAIGLKERQFTYSIMIPVNR